MIPKTWENPKAEHPEMKAFGDNDPVRIPLPSTLALSTSQPLNVKSRDPPFVTLNPKFETRNSKAGIASDLTPFYPNSQTLNNNYSTPNPQPTTLNPKP
jgi:hypothetical protein